MIQLTAFRVNKTLFESTYSPSKSGEPLGHKSMEKSNSESSKVIPQHEQIGMKHACDDVGNMHRFIEHNQDRLRYIVEKSKWAVWDGTRWNINRETEVFKMAIDTACRIYEEASTCPTEEGRKRLASWANQSQAHHRIKTMVTMASKYPEMTSHAYQFDTDLSIVNCVNGVLDLRTRQLEKHSSTHLITKRAAVSYDDGAKCPQFFRFLNEVFSGDKELIRWIQLALGYTMTGLSSEQTFFIAYGTGANGKSTLFELLLEILGDYGRSAEFETFLSQEKSNIRVMESVAKLQGIRFALASETDSARRFSEALVKKITGNDTITGSFLYGSSFEFRPEFKLWLLANHLPIAKDGSHGFWRRVKVVPFSKQFDLADIDQTLPDRLRTEKEGIFAWLVRGAHDWLEARDNPSRESALGTSQAVEEATNLYRSDHDLFSHFISECIADEPTATTKAADLYEAYLEWCQNNGHSDSCSNVIFSSRLQERGYSKRRKSSGYVYMDIIIQYVLKSTTDF